MTSLVSLASTLSLTLQTAAATILLRKQSTLSRTRSNLKFKLPQTTDADTLPSCNLVSVAKPEVCMPSQTYRFPRIVPLCQALTVFVVLSLSISAYQRTVHPLFSSSPVDRHLSNVVYGFAALAAVTPKLTIGKALTTLGMMLLFTPISSYWVGVHVARLHRPILGPLVTHCVVLGPIIFSGAAFMKNIDGCLLLFLFLLNYEQLRIAAADLFGRCFISISEDFTFTMLGDIVFAISIWHKVLQSRRWTAASIHHHQTPKQRYYVLTSAYLPIIFAASFTFFPGFWNPTLAHPLLLSYAHPTYPLRVLSSVQSNTGIVVVGELLSPSPKQATRDIHSIRYLRASHTLLGGVWIDEKMVMMDSAPPITDQEGTALGDSIYSAFVLQDAARLAVDFRDDVVQQQKKANALIIGLGAGISASAFMRHNISTTIVEIDSAVYDAAHRFFGLPDTSLDRVFLEDARGWVEDRRRSITSSDDPGEISKYDIVIHDCFSGGGVPADLYSLEFWEDLKAIVNPHGVIAVNYGGKLGTDSFLAIMTTLQRSFRSCRAFHDFMDPITDKQLRTTFLNLVFFCTSSTEPIIFRPTVDADFLHSHLRRHILSSLAQREVDLNTFGSITSSSPQFEAKYILTQRRNELARWQREEALEHWKLMREVLPDVVWEIF